MNKIRIGIIRCDTHAAWYGAMMGKHDPYLLREPIARGAKSKKTWQSGAVHYYFYTIYHSPTVMTAPFVEGFEITRLWDDDREVAETLSNVFDSKPIVCDTFEQASDDVDMVFIACCAGIGDLHRELSKPGIEKGVPTFIDKPLAYDLADAQAIVADAQKHDTPILSMSILRALPQGAQFAARLPEVGDLEFGTVRGGGSKMSGFIHTISLSQNVFGPGGVESVQATGKEKQVHVHLHYREGSGGPRNGVMLNCDSGATFHSAFYASAYGSQGAIHSGDLGDFQFPSGTAVILEMCKEMVSTRRPPVPYPEILENIAVATAAREALNSGSLVRLNDVGFDATSSEIQ
jgi:predicted dehydrogenase